MSLLKDLIMIFLKNSLQSIKRDIDNEESILNKMIFTIHESFRFFHKINTILNLETQVSH